MLGVIKRPFFIRGKEAEKYNLILFFCFLEKQLVRFLKSILCFFKSQEDKVHIRVAKDK